MTQRRSGLLPEVPRPLRVGVITSGRTLCRPARLERRRFDLVEVRLDLVGAGTPDWLSRCRELERRGIPVLLTIRAAREGGTWRGTAAARRELYRQALPWVSAVDVEIRSPLFTALAREVRAARKTLVGSFHDFTGTPAPARLREVIRIGRRGGAHIVKVAATVRRPDDVITLFELLRLRRAGPLCLIGMGPQGLHTRVSLAGAGSCLVYGALDAPSAPGQMDCRELDALLARLGIR